MYDFKEKVQLGNTGVSIRRMGLGTGGLGGSDARIGAEGAAQLIRTAYQEGMDFLDTAAMYGGGSAERVLGGIVPGLPRDSFTIATKAGIYIPNPPASEEESRRFGLGGGMIRDYSYDGVMYCFEESLKRLGLDSVDILYLHGPSKFDEGGYRAVCELRAQGLIKAIGGSGYNAEGLYDLMKNGDFDCIMIAGRYTLMEQGPLADILPLALKKNISVLTAGVLNSGILADPYNVQRYDYRPVDAPTLEKAQNLDAVCKRYNIPLKAAAVQFSLAHPAIVSVIVGPLSEAELRENMQLVQLPIPKALWQEMKQEGLLPEEAPVPEGI
ncbi:MAG: aldo/keto reductase [Oscillospiraceae bacterium]|nr:aldo/keto reductase [Oscillospiraceae bacterium]